MRKILEVLSTLEQGGTESVVLNYLNNMDTSLFQIDFLVIYGDKKGYYEDNLKKCGHKIFKLKNTPRKVFAYRKEVKKFFSLNEYDVVHIHAMNSLRYNIAKAAKKSGVKTTIYHSHTSHCDSHPFLHKIFKARLEKWCDVKISCGYLAGKYMYSGKFMVLNNAINVNRFVFDPQKREKLREEYGIVESYVVGNVGRLVNVKNQIFLLNVAKILKERNEKFILIIVGDGDNYGKLLEFTEKSGLSENVKFIKPVGEKIAEYYSLFDVFAFPSLYEGLSVALLETQANGVPILASDRIPKENAISKKFVFLPIDENEETYRKWADAIAEWKQKRVDGANAVAAAGYEITREAKKLEKLYNGCL